MLKCFIFLLVIVPAFSSAQDPLDVLSRSYANAEETLRPTNSLRGQFRPVHFSVISAGIDGTLSEFPVKTGSTVRKAQLIARFSCHQENAENEIAAARVEVARKNLEVNEKLEEYQNISELELTKSGAELEITKADAKRTQAIVDRCVITSPFNATVTEKFVQAHQYVKKGDPLLELVDTENLEIEMVLPSLDISSYKSGRKFSILVDETGDHVLAKVDRVVNVVDPVSQTVRVIGVLAQPARGLMPGMSGIISFDTE